MQRFRDQILARSRRSGDKGGAIMRHAADAREQIPHQRAASDHSFEPRRLHQFAVQRQRALPLAGIG